MIRDQVKARRVGDSLVLTLTKPVVKETGIAEGDSLMLETVSQGRIIISKEVETVTTARKVELELEILRKRQSALREEIKLAVVEYNKNMPTVHPGIDDQDLMELSMQEFHWDQANLDVAISEKRLELFELGGHENI